MTRGPMSQEQKDKISATRRRRFIEGTIVPSHWRKKAIYELPYGIKVITECHRKDGRVVCIIEAHPLFPNSKITAQGRQLVQRSRVFMTAKLGRSLGRNEHVHHEEEKDNDSLEKLELKSSGDHNRYHKTGTTHRQESKDAISYSMEKAHRIGLHKKPEIVERDKLGRIVRSI